SAYGHRLHLHSFPTRRASDLSETIQKFHERTHRHRQIPAAAGRTGRLDRSRPRLCAPRFLLVALRPFLSAPRRLLSRLPGGAERSEEHTSELQSRENLVCRLL